MSKFERILVPGSTELPDCRCGAEMRMTSTTPRADSPDVELRVYQCSVCDHELRLTVWKTAAA